MLPDMSTIDAATVAVLASYGSLVLATAAVVLSVFRGR
ncbi:hypothetical protein SEA_SEUME_2 [Arthrobacter phage Seume]|uniref:Holin n=1 Tax=Arthrobacter phage Seume TaxID=2015867 RepID=A0A222ZHC8_9CAUD|nr:hypothetical protein SEA_SEUME_2 [Arthrobacter phage Seume]